VNETVLVIILGMCPNGTLEVSKINSIHSMTFPVLTYIACGMLITENSELASAKFPTLTYADNDIAYVYFNIALPVLDFPVLATSTFGVDIEANSVLTSVAFPALTFSGAGVSVISNNLLTIATFPVLSNISGDVLYVESNNALTSVAFPLLISADSGIAIDNTDALKSIIFPSLTFIGGDALYIYYNAFKQSYAYDISCPSTQPITIPPLPIRCQFQRRRLYYWSLLVELISMREPVAVVLFFMEGENLYVFWRVSITIHRDQYKLNHTY
jgi:hypothetical protein